MKLERSILKIKWMRSLTLSILLRKVKIEGKENLKILMKKFLIVWIQKKTKMAIEFNDRESASIKSFAVKKRWQIKVTTRFISGKLLMFAKLSLKSFIYEITETFGFSKENVKKKNDKYRIEKVEIFHVLTDTDRTVLKFIFISDPNSEIPEDKFRDIIFEVIIESEIYKRFDSSHEFWDIFNTRKKNKRKTLGYY